jgi:hypothetical protein
MVSRVIAAPVDQVWHAFVDPGRRREWASDGGIVQVTVLEPRRRCVVRLVAAESSYRREYAFRPIEVGPHRGSTIVTVSDERSPVLAVRLLDLIAGGFAARTVEGAVRQELDTLAAACTGTIITRTAA